MEKRNNVSYKEVSFDGQAMVRNYKHPMTKVYQYEYALFIVMSALFQSVKCKSFCPNSLKLYFKELPLDVKEEDLPEDVIVRKSQRKLIEEIETLVERDVIGKIKFPMINACSAEVLIKRQDDETHRFFYTDGIYGFSVHLDMERKGHPRCIEVKNIIT